jgi:hypothetical protein
MRILPFFVGFCASGAAVFAQLPATSPLNLPVVGLASSETVQVNVVDLLQPSLDILPLTSTPAACSGTIVFYNAAGSAIGNPASFSLNAGQISWAALRYSDVSGGSGNARSVVRATVTTTAPCSLNTNIETYDTTTGVTHVHVEGPSIRLFPNLRLGLAR